MNMKSFKYCILLTSLSVSIYAQFTISGGTITGGQSTSSSEEFGLQGSSGSQTSDPVSSDSFSVSQGSAGITQQIYMRPPDIKLFISDTLYKTGESILVRGILTDLNGVAGADFIYQKGGSNDSISIPMVAVDDSTYEVLIDDSLLTPKNFKSYIRGTDNLSYSGGSDIIKPTLGFGKNILSMSIEGSKYPKGIVSNRWRLVSFPGVLKDEKISNPYKKKGYAFYSWDMTDSSWVISDSIKVGEAYWFKHMYKNSIPFFADSGIALPLDPYTMKLKEGWNMIGSPFAFPVSVERDSNLVSPLYFYGDSSKKNGWEVQNGIMNPWAGYVVKSQSDTATIKLIPFALEKNLGVAKKINDSWENKISIESNTYFDRSGVIGSRKSAKDDEDILDIQSLPILDNKLSIVMSINNNDVFKNSSDIRSSYNMNGVWDVRIIRSQEDGEIILSNTFTGLNELGLKIITLDIQNRYVHNILENKDYVIRDNFRSIYELKFIVGDESYVNRMISEILSNIPIEHSLSQNYPNPFNPKTVINYELRRTGNTRITIYNILGQEVRSLVNGLKNYGKHTIVWNGQDKSGKLVSSGVYFSEMVINDFRSTRKMVLMK